MGACVAVDKLIINTQGAKVWQKDTCQSIASCVIMKFAVIFSA